MLRILPMLAGMVLLVEADRGRMRHPLQPNLPPTP